MTRSVPLTRAQQAKWAAGDISTETVLALLFRVAGHRGVQPETISATILHRRLWMLAKRRSRG